MCRNFAFGTNLLRSKMRSRGVEWASAEPGVLEGWALSFNQAGFPPVEPSFASVVPLASDGDVKAATTNPPHCHGVVYTMTPEHFDKLWEVSTL